MATPVIILGAGASHDYHNDANNVPLTNKLALVLGQSDFVAHTDALSSFFSST